MKERGIKKTKIGQVVSDRMHKTVVVEVVRDVIHPVFKKHYKKVSKFYAHDEKNEAKAGDFVKIAQTKPISKLKKWKVLEIVRKGISEEPTAEAGVSQKV